MELTNNGDAGPNTVDAEVAVQLHAGQSYFIGVNAHTESSRAYDPLTGAGAVAGGQGNYLLQVHLHTDNRGDFNGDGQLDAHDLALLATALHGPRPESRFDLNADGEVDLRDRDTWLIELRETRPGDVNLNGRVEFDDFVTLAANFNRLDAVWSEGDFNLDGVVDFADFVELASFFGFEAVQSIAISLLSRL
jgi:hypothetical protein